MTTNTWPYLDCVQDDLYIIQLLQEFHYLTNEKEEPAPREADSVASGDEAPESF